MTNKTWIFSVLFFIYVYANEEKDSSVVLWYPIPIHLTQLQALTQSENLSKCQEFILKHLVRPNFAKQINGCNNTKIIEQIFDTESKVNLTDTIKFPTTVGEDIISVRQGDVEPQESLENVSNGVEDKSIESRIITLPHRDALSEVQGVTKSIFNPSRLVSIITRQNPDTVEAMALKNNTFMPNEEIFNEEDLVYKGMIQVPSDNFKEKDDVITRIDATAVNNDVTSGANEDLGALVKDYIDRGEGNSGKPCNCTTLLTKLLQHYLTQVNSQK